MLKKMLEKSAFDALHEELQKFYKLGDDGKYRLQLEDDDAEPLRRAKDHEVGLRQIAERDRDVARAELATAQAKITSLEGSLSADTTALRADHERTVQGLNDKHAKDREGLEGVIRNIYVTQVASRIATEIAIDAGAAELLQDSIARRLKVEIVNGSPVTRVLALDGTASNASPDDLKAEYLQMTKFAGILRASDASGGGAIPSSPGGGASKKLKDMGDAERTQMSKENPTEWRRLLAEDAAENAG